MTLHVGWKMESPRSTFLAGSGNHNDSTREQRYKPLCIWLLLLLPSHLIGRSLWNNKCLRDLRKLKMVIMEYMISMYFQMKILNLKYVIFSALCNGRSQTEEQTLMSNSVPKDWLTFDSCGMGFQSSPPSWNLKTVLHLPSWPITFHWASNSTAAFYFPSPRDNIFLCLLGHLAPHLWFDLAEILTSPGLPKSDSRKEFSCLKDIVVLRYGMKALEFVTSSAAFLKRQWHFQSHKVSQIGIRVILRMLPPFLKLAPTPTPSLGQGVYHIGWRT